MSILGRAPDVFDLYEQGVRREYAHIPQKDWNNGRGNFLKSIASPLFLTDYFKQRYEVQAQDNIARSVAKHLRPLHTAPFNKPDQLLV